MDKARAVVHVTQGTYAVDDLALTLPTIRALEREDVLVVATTPNADSLGGLPANVRLEKTIPHSLLLPHVDVMVSNGGYNGVKTALAFGVPVVAGGDSEDKPEVSARLAYTGAGIDLRTGRPSQEQVLNAVRRVLATPSYGAKARGIQAEFSRHDSAREALALLARLIESGTTVPRP